MDAPPGLLCLAFEQTPLNRAADLRVSAELETWLLLAAGGPAKAQIPSGPTQALSEGHPRAAATLLKRCPSWCLARE